MSNERWQSAKRILCVRLDTLGDVLMCTPALRALRESVPDRHLTLLTSSIGAHVAAHLPEVDQAIVYRPPWMKHGAVQGTAYQLDMVRQLRECDFDAAVIFTSYTQSSLPAAMLCYLAGIPLRLAHCRENPYDLLTEWVPETDLDPSVGVRHEVRRQLDLVHQIGCRTTDERLSFHVSETALQETVDMLAALGIAPMQPWLLMHPGATAASRRYPPAQWAEVIRRVAMEFGLPIVLTGDASETALIDGILVQSGVRAHALAGCLNLEQLAAAIKLSAVAVSNNTGPAHIAAAVGTPVVDLYALTNPQHMPWQVESRVLYHDVPCRYCYKSVCPQGHHACLEQVQPSEVVAALREMLELAERKATASVLAA